ncbi:MAG: DUF2244 domain-containing protein [Acetobacteraceae bacterium]
MDTVLFQATIVPHRSLSPGGVRAVIGLILGCAALILLRAWLIGAWPVLGFGVVEIGLAVTLLRWNARHTSDSELVLLTEATLAVIRTDAAGRRTELRLPAGWLNVVLEEEPGQVPRLLLAAHAIRQEIGCALGEAERRDLAAALRSALWRMRNPLFDNKQLREPMAPSVPSP